MDILGKRQIFVLRNTGNIIGTTIDLMEDYLWQDEANNCISYYPVFIY